MIGVLDLVSTRCPDEEMEAAMLEQARVEASRRGGGVLGRGGKKASAEALAPDQRSLKDFMTSSQNGGKVLESTPSLLRSSLQQHQYQQQERHSAASSPTTMGPTYYITDIKTRQSRTLPPPGAQSKPTHMQLMLYHRLLTSLAAGEVPAEKIFERYKLRPGRALQRYLFSADSESRPHSLFRPKWKRPAARRITGKRRLAQNHAGPTSGQGARQRERGLVNRASEPQYPRLTVGPPYLRSTLNVPSAIGEQYARSHDLRATDCGIPNCAPAFFSSSPQNLRQRSRKRKGRWEGRSHIPRPSSLSPQHPETGFILTIRDFLVARGETHEGRGGGRGVQVSDLRVCGGL